MLTDLLKGEALSTVAKAYNVNVTTIKGYLYNYPLIPKCYAELDPLFEQCCQKWLTDDIDITR